MISAKGNHSMNRYLKSIWKRKLVLSAHIILAIIILVVVVARLYPADPYHQDLSQHLRPPGLSHATGTVPHLLGTDALGRDLLARLLLATRTSLTVGVLAVAIACVVGTILGLLAGYFGGVLDNVIMRLVDALLSLPFVVLAIAIVAAIGQSFINIIIVLGMTGWVTFAKLIRGEVLRIKESPHIEAAVAIGCPGYRIILMHILPSVAGLIFVSVTLTLGQMIIAEATLSFLGLGIPPPIPTLGGILSDAQTIFFSAWWIVVFPGVFLVAVVLCANLIGDFLRDYFDPQLRRER